MGLQALFLGIRLWLADGAGAMAACCPHLGCPGLPLARRFGGSLATIAASTNPLFAALMRANGRAPDVLGGWMDGWMDGWDGVRALNEMERLSGLALLWTPGRSPRLAPPAVARVESSHTSPKLTAAALPSPRRETPAAGKTRTLPRTHTPTSYSAQKNSCYRTTCLAPTSGYLCCRGLC